MSVKAKFCGCDSEPLPSKTGQPVFIKSKGILTLNPKEAHKDHQQPVGAIDAQHRFALSQEAEKALELLQK